MTKEEAYILLSFHSCKNNDIENEKWENGFLGSLRPFQGKLYECNFIEIMECLKVLADDFMDLSTKARYISFGQKKLRMPLVLSNKGYAIGVAAGSTVLFCNVRTYGQYIYTQGTGQIDYYFIYDENQERNIEQYRNLPV